MITNNEYQNYFHEVGILERKLIYKVRDLMGSIQEGRISNILNANLEDQIRHYGLIRLIFERILCKEAKELRKHERKYWLGNVRMKPLPSGQEIMARCTNLSEGGMGIDLESNLQLPLGSCYELQINLFNQAQALRRVGKLLWLKRFVWYGAGQAEDPALASIDFEVSIGGIQFESS
jgi:hypothetical protein